MAYSIFFGSREKYWRLSMFNVMFQRRGWIEEYMAESSTARNQSSWRVFVITLSPALLLPSDCLSIVLQQKLPSSDECIYSVSSVQFSCSVVSDSLQPHEPQHTRPPCPSPTPEVHPNPCPLSRWCQPTIYPLSSLSPTFNLSQHQGLFKWVSS